MQDATGEGWMVFHWFLIGAIAPPTIPATSTGTGGESIDGDGLRSFKQCGAMADCLLNPKLPRGIRNSRDISKQGKEIFGPPSLCGGSDKHPHLPCLQPDSDCRDANTGEGEMLDDLRGRNPRARCLWCGVTHQGQIKTDSE